MPGETDIRTFAPVDPLAGGDPLGGLDLFPQKAEAPPPAPDPRRDPAPPAEIDLEDHGDIEVMDPKTFTPEAITDTPPPAAPKEERETPKKLRKEIEDRNARVKALEEELAAERARPKPDANEITGMKSELETLRAERKKEEDARNRQDARNHPEVKAIENPFTDKVGNFTDAIAMQGYDGKKLGIEFGDILVAAQQLGRQGSEGYNDRRSEFLNRIEEYGPENKAQIIQLVNEGIRVLHESSMKQKEVADNALAYTYKERQIAYGKHVQGFEAIADNWGKTTDQEAEADPLKPANIFHRMMKENESVKQADVQVRNFLRAAINPPPPFNPADEAIMGRDAWRQQIDTALDGHNQARKMMISGARDAFMALRVVPSLVKRISDLEGQLKTRRAEAPKVEAADHQRIIQDQEDNPDGPRDARTFKPSAIAI